MFETVELNIIPVGDAPVVHCSQYDINRLLRFEIVNGDEPMTFSNLISITTTIRKVDGTLWKYEDDSPVIVSGIYDMFTDEQMTACSGNNPGELTIKYRDSDVTDEDIQISTLNFILKVELSPECGGLVSQSEISNLSGQIALIIDSQLSNYYTKSEIDDQIETIVTEQVTPIVADIVAEQVPPAVEAELSNYYTKDETDTYFYNKTETDALLSNKADTSDLPDMDDYYTKTDTDTLLAGKVSNSTLNNYYTKSQVDALVGTFDIIDNASGSIITINNGGDNIPVKEFIIDISAFVDGFTEVDITVFDVNIWNESWESGVWDSSGNKTTGTAIRCTDHIPVKPNTSYFGYSVFQRGLVVRFYGADKTIKRTEQIINSTFTTNADEYYVTINTYNADNITTYSNNISINYPDTDITYHASKAVNYTVSLGETLTQGGTLNVTTGLLTRTDETTSQLTATAVNTLSGLNNIYSSTGDVTVTYFNDKADQIAALFNAMGGI